MNLNPAMVLNPVFNALDALIADYGVYLYLVFVWLSLGVIVWVLGGGFCGGDGHKETPPRSFPASSSDATADATTTVNHHRRLLTRHKMATTKQ